MNSAPVWRIDPPNEKLLDDVALADGDPLTLLLSLPVRQCIEGGLTEAAPSPASLLSLVVTSRSAYVYDPGGAFAAALALRHPVAAARVGDVRLCLNEAIANGLMHGNLGLATAETPAEFQLQAELLETRIRNPDFAERPVAICAESQGSDVVITVTDGGSGFVLTQSGGRGLGLIGAHCDDVRHELGGRRIVMLFRAGSADALSE